MLIRKKVYFNKKITHPYHSLGNYRNTFKLSYSIKYVSPVKFCEYMLGVNYMSYDEDFA